MNVLKVLRKKTKCVAFPSILLFCRNDFNKFNSTCLSANLFVSLSWRGGLVVERRGFDPHSGRHVVSLSKIHLPP